MTDAASQPETIHIPVVEEQVEGLPPGFGDGLAGKVAFLIAVAFSLFQLYVAAYGAIPSPI
ncbi:MAG: hypothetical protein ACTHNH_06050, partial [Mesorhizobium sp.]